MYRRIIWNDILKSKMISITTIVFVAVAATLVSLAAILIVNLFGAMDTLMQQAKTPHFMQMHTGNLDAVRLLEFAENKDNVDEFQVLEFLNIDGADILLGEESLSGNIQDNGFSAQSKKFDYLIDLEGKKINVKKGEVYVPLCYMKDKTTQIGDKAVVGGKEFRVAGFLRDSQMNPALSSSKRFLIHEEDYAVIRELGKVEYLIEFRLKDMSGIGAFETAYMEAKLETNGPTITYQLFKVMNAFSDGLMIAVLLLISVLVVAIAFLCIRFTLLAKLEEDYGEIGVMKAIGMRTWDIKKTYLAKYAAISLSGCILGFGFSLVFKELLLENIRLFMGESKNVLFTSVSAIFAVILLFLIIVSYVNVMLKRFRKISAAEAIRFGIKQDNTSGTRYLSLRTNKLLSTNIFLGIQDILARKNLYVTSLLVLLIAVFIMIIPQNLYHTISAKSFSAYMGIGDCDMRIDIQQTDDIQGKAEQILQEMRHDSAILEKAVFMTRAFKTDNKENLNVELGDHSLFSIVYSEGNAPRGNGEIALSAINAEELQKEVGDTVILEIMDNSGDYKKKNFTVCGIYSDITNGGKTAKAVFDDGVTPVMWCKIYTKLVNPLLVKRTVSEYAEKFTFAKISDIDEYIRQTFGETISSVRKASYAAVMIAIAITVLVILLFMKMLIAKDRYSIAVMKAFGFTNRDIIVQYATRSLVVFLIAMLLGTMLANILGENLVGILISSFGASSFQFKIDPFSVYLLYPLLMAGAVLIATMAAASGVRNIKISEHIKE